MNFTVAIDGPAGSGKSSVSKKIADKTDFNHLDTGAMYRAITYVALSNNINIKNEDEYDFIHNIKIEFKNGLIHVDNKDVSKEIRTPEVTRNVSVVASLKIVRDNLKKLQQSASSKGLHILDGRDIGTNVLPNANLKIFLTASSAVRAERRHKENLTRGINTSLEELEKEIIKRDKLDSEREHAPLKQASDAVLIDTSNLNEEEVINKVINLIEERM